MRDVDAARVACARVDAASVFLREDVEQALEPRAERPIEMEPSGSGRCDFFYSAGLLTGWLSKREEVWNSSAKNCPRRFGEGCGIKRFCQRIVDPDLHKPCRIHKRRTDSGKTGEIGLSSIRIQKRPAVGQPNGSSLLWLSRSG